jgi:hypothetical protein
MEKPLALDVRHVLLVVADHHLAQPEQLLRQRPLGVKQVGAQEAEEGQEAEVLAAVRRPGEKKIMERTRSPSINFSRNW